MPFVRPTGKAWLDLTAWTAPVTRDGVAVVALLDAGEEAIPAGLGAASSSSDRTGPACFELAGRATAVTRHGVAVVALLGAGNLAVATQFGGLAGSTGDRANVVGFYGTLGIAPVPARGVPVIAGLAERHLHDAVSTEFGKLARPTRGGANPTRLGEASR
jgi:hypothetical protein